MRVSILWCVGIEIAHTYTHTHTHARTHAHTHTHTHTHTHAHTHTHRRWLMENTRPALTCSAAVLQRARVAAS
jgi:hypothetical protein